MAASDSKSGIAARVRAGAVYLLGVLLVLVILDHFLALRVEAALGEAREQIAVGRPMVAEDAGLRVHVIEGLEADLCNALTGGLWLSVLLPQTRSAARFDDLVAEPVGGRCRRGSSRNAVKLVPSW